MIWVSSKGARVLKITINDESWSSSMPMTMWAPDTFYLIKPSQSAARILRLPKGFECREDGAMKKFQSAARILRLPKQGPDHN